MEGIIFVTLIALVIILAIVCFWQRFVIRWNLNDIDQIMDNVWKLQDKYEINDEDIRSCFVVKHN